MSDELRQVFAELSRRVPISLAVRECMRLAALLKILPAQGTLLDVGCGDGSFWQSYPRRQDLIIDGVDLNQHEVRLARQSGVYRKLSVCDISQVVPDESYDLALGNCSMEHIPDINQALKNLGRCLKPGGRLLLFVPAFGWPRSLSLVHGLGRFSSRLEMAAAGALDGFFQHHHIYDQTSWCLLVQNAGFTVNSCMGLGSTSINRCFERQLPLALSEFVFKSLFKRYPPSWGQRRLPGEPFWRELAAQPVAVDDPQVVEYIVDATTPALP